MRTKILLLAMVFAFGVLFYGCPKKTPPPPPPPPPPVEEETTVVAPPEEPTPPPPKPLELKPVYFGFDRYDLTEEAKAILAENARQLMEHKDVKIRLEGNCDERGTNEYNLALGQKRAESVKQFLVNYGISPDRIETVSYGEERPVCTEHNEDCWRLNRRVDFKIISQ